MTRIRLSTSRGCLLQVGQLQPSNSITAICCTSCFYSCEPVNSITLICCTSSFYSWRDFDWHSVSCGPSAVAGLLVKPRSCDGVQWFDWQGEGRSAHAGRLPAVRGDDVQVRVRSPGGQRRVLVHGWHRLDHRAHVRLLRTARQRCHQRHGASALPLPYVQGSHAFWKILELRL